MRRGLVGLLGLIVLGSGVVTPRPAAALDSCSVSGTYNLSGFALGNAEVLGSLVFAPNGACTGGTFSGAVTVKVDGSAPIRFPPSGTYLVNPDLTVTITNTGGVTVTLSGLVSELNGNVANAIQAVGDVGGALNVGLTLTRSVFAAGAGDNTAVGFDALAANTTGRVNTAVGFDALAANTTGGGNTAVGFAALTANTTGGNNTALGIFALIANTTGRFNTAVGNGALSTNTTGATNTAVGDSALGRSTGSNNIALGEDAGSLLTSGSNNIDIGNVGVAGESATTRIGAQGVGTGQTFIAGVSGVTTGGAAITVLIDANGQLGTASSSRRVKEEIQDMVDASEPLLRLRPVSFRYRNHADGGLRQYGLIAEEVAEVLPDLVVSDQAGQPETVRYHLLPALLLNELQKQHRQLTEQQAQLQAQAQTIAALQARLERLLSLRAEE